MQGFPFTPEVRGRHRALGCYCLYCHQEAGRNLSRLMPWLHSMDMSKPMSPGPSGITNGFDTGVQQVTELLVLSI